MYMTLRHYVKAEMVQKASIGWMDGMGSVVVSST